MVTLDAARIKYPEYFQYFRGNIKPLFDIPSSQVNGLSYVGVNELTTDYNYFAAASRFFIDAMLGDVPETVRLVYPIFERIVTHWAVTGEYCGVLSGGTFRVINPANVHPMPVGAEKQDVTGYLLVYPHTLPNGLFDGYATVISYDIATGAAFQNVRGYSPGIVADVGTEPIPVRIDAVIWDNTGDGMYPYIAGIVRELNIRAALIQSNLNSTSYPLLQMSADNISGVSSQRDITHAHINSLGKSALGVLVEPGFTGENEPRYIERSGAGLEESLAYVRLLLGLLSVMSGVPDYVYGVSLNQNPTEIERVLFAGQARINRLRRSLESAFSRLGLPILFTTEPFSTRKSRLDGIRQLYSEGIITLAEARAALGWGANNGAGITR